MKVDNEWNDDDDDEVNSLEWNVQFLTIYESSFNSFRRCFHASSTDDDLLRKMTTLDVKEWEKALID